MAYGRDSTFLSIQEREIGFVFQNYALFKHMTVYENIAFGLDVRNNQYFTTPVLKKPSIDKKRIRKINNVFFFKTILKELSFSTLPCKGKGQKKFLNGLYILLFPNNINKKKFKIVYFNFFSLFN